MTWNHRIIRRTNAPSIDPEWNLQIHEVYYDKDGTITNWTSNAVAPLGEDIAELRIELTHFLEALDHPVLEEVEIEGEVQLIEIDGD